MKLIVLITNPPEVAKILRRTAPRAMSCTAAWWWRGSEPWLPIT
jgi:hypothetical protein